MTRRLHSFAVAGLLVLAGASVFAEQTYVESGVNGAGKHHVIAEAGSRNGMKLCHGTPELPREPLALLPSYSCHAVSASVPATHSCT